MAKTRKPITNIEASAAASVAAKEAPSAGPIVGLTDAESADLRGRYPEGIPNWVASRGYTFKQIDDLMQMRRRAFPVTAR